MHLSLKGSMDRQPLTDRLGDKLLAEYGGAAAAYSLRSLSGDQTKVVRVRRSSDNAEKDFTASEMGAALEDWVNTDYEVYSSDFSTTQGWTSPSSAVTITSEDGIGGLNDVLELDCSETSGRFGAYKLTLGLETGEKHSVTFRYYTTDSSFSGKYWNVGNAFSNVNVVTSSTNDQIVSDGTWREVTLAFNNENSGLRLKVSDASGGAYGSLLTALSGSIYIRDVVLTTTHANGYVETWYDQSGNGNDATQTVAANQPKIVDTGALVSGGIDFDGVDDYFLSSHILSSDDVLSLYAVGAFDDLTQRGTMVRDLFYVSNSNNGGFSLENNTFTLSGRIAGYGDDALVAHNAASFITEGSESLFEMQLAGGSSSFYVNGSSVDTISATMNSEDGGSVLAIGANATGTNLFIGQITEIIIYSSDQSSNRPAIEANINNQYDIY